LQESCLLPLALKQELKEVEVQMFLFGFCNKKLFKIERSKWGEEESKHQSVKSWYTGSTHLQVELNVHK
jgi:hypothetical protein